MFYKRISWSLLLVAWCAVASVHAFEPKASAALEQLPVGTIIALQAVHSEASYPTGKFLQLEKGGKWLKATGESKDDPLCQFEVTRWGNWIGFKSVSYAARQLQAVPNQHEVRFENWNFHSDGHTWEHWSLEPEKDDSLDVVRIKNQAVGSYLCVHKNTPDYQWNQGRVWTAWRKEGNTLNPSGAGTWEKLKVVIVKPAPAKELVTAGGKEFYFSRSMNRGAGSVWDEKWKLPKAGQGWIKFKAKAPLDVYVFISSATSENKDTYWMAIGGWSNTQSGIHSHQDGKWQVLVNRADAGDSVTVTGGWQQPDPWGKHHRKDADWLEKAGFEGREWGDYWVKLDNGIVSFGKGTELGENVIAIWRDPNPASNLQYFGLGGWFLNVEFKDITWGSDWPKPKGEAELQAKVDRLTKEVTGLTEQLQKAREEADKLREQIKPGKGRRRRGGYTEESAKRKKKGKKKKGAKGKKKAGKKKGAKGKKKKAGKKKGNRNKKKAGKKKGAKKKGAKGKKKKTGKKKHKKGKKAKQATVTPAAKQEAEAPAAS